MASITWTDDTGEATLTNSKPGQGGRFMSWTPRSVPYGDADSALGTGQRSMFTFRTDYMASFDMPGIPNTDMEKMLRLQLHLYAGGQVEVATDDNASRTYNTCCMAEDSQVEIDFSDSTFIEYTMRFLLLNVDASPDHMLCIYE
jgi:hypothetical protein